MLHGVDQRRLTRHLLDVHQAFQPQQACAAVLDERFEEQRERERGNGAVAQQAEGLDAVGVDGAEWAVRDWRGRGEARRSIAAGEQRRRRHVTRVVQDRAAEAFTQCLARSGNIRLAQQQRVGKGDLASCLRMAVQRRFGVQHVDDRDHAVDHVKLGHIAVGHQRMQDRRGIGEAGGLDQHSVIGDVAGLAASVQIEQRCHEVAAYGAAETASRQCEQRFVAACDQLVIEADLAEFIDDDRGAGKGGIAQDARDQRGLATAEKSGDDGDGNLRRRQWTAPC